MGATRNIVVVPYDPVWPGKFEVAVAELSPIFGAELIAIHHIGSTAIPGLSAKPIIDMMPVVRDIARVDALNPAFVRRGYEPMGEHGIPGRRYFVKGGDLHRTHHVHIYEPNNPEVKRHLGFRDYLIAHPDQARQYASLKQDLARQYPHDIEGYMAGKDAFIKAIIQEAERWRVNKAASTSK